MNKVILVGRISNDLELSTSKSNINFLRFTIAVDRRNWGSSENPITDFIPVVAWRQTATFLANAASKGSRVAVEGIFTSNRFTNAQGQNVTSYEVSAENVELLESKSESESRRNRVQSNFGSSNNFENKQPSTNVSFDPINSNYQNELQPSKKEVSDKDEEDWDLDSFL